MDAQKVIRQEAQVGHHIEHLGGDVFLEVSKFKGKTYAGIRRWFEADDGKAYRTKNGLNMGAEDMKQLFEHLSENDATVIFLAGEIANPWEDKHGQ
jgi:hypothetical protein